MKEDAGVSISHVVAVSEAGVIGTNGSLPWHLPSDLRFFRELTFGRPVVMGRKTFSSIGSPLRGRKNIVITRDTSLVHEDVLFVRSWEEAKDRALEDLDVSGEKEFAVIGGGEIYQATFPEITRIHLTIVKDGGMLPGDTFYPEFVKFEEGKEHLERSFQGWEEKQRLEFPRLEGEQYDRRYLLLERK